MRSNLRLRQALECGKRIASAVAGEPNRSQWFNRIGILAVLIAMGGS